MTTAPLEQSANEVPGAIDDPNSLNLQFSEQNERDFPEKKKKEERKDLIGFKRKQIRNREKSSSNLLGCLQLPPVFISLFQGWNVH